MTRPPFSNITYHDVKGQREDMEKKRSLQGGGENVLTKADTCLSLQSHLYNVLNPILWIGIV
jgi:hypothetical protein